jgi:hypothetical protein
VLIEAADGRVQTLDVEALACERAEIGDQSALARAAHDGQTFELGELLVGAIADVLTAQGPAQPGLFRFVDATPEDTGSACR